MIFPPHWIRLYNPRKMPSETMVSDGISILRIKYQRFSILAASMA
ncbi:hypothetical protein [Neisseria meningitidis serogroup B]|uniref:Uncharacterized protein n=1 Tax=Neisseria meningitidis serogroup B TaxID=491 RepID=A0A0H5QCB4_NEIMI|nr:hypothetical protein [Neisseria meningitidis serogroup B]